MNFTSFYVLFISTLASFALALPLHAARDVYAPPVTSPAAGTEWVVNSTQTVTWYVDLSSVDSQLTYCPMYRDVSSPPEQITNRFHSSLRLRKGDRTTPRMSRFFFLSTRIGR